VTLSSVSDPAWAVAKPTIQTHFFVQVDHRKGESGEIAALFSYFIRLNIFQNVVLNFPRLFLLLLHLHRKVLNDKALIN